MYYLFLPATVREMLQAVQFTVSPGIEGIPLACIRAKGYVSCLVMWTVSPLLLISWALRLLKERNYSIPKLLSAVAPISLYVFFLTFPIANRAFEAFSCHTFDDGSEWLIADVRPLSPLPLHTPQQIRHTHTTHETLHTRH